MRQKENIDTIYQAALAVFARYGFRKATLADIAERLHMTKSNLYLYARNKKDLYRNTVSWALLRWQRRVQEAIAQETDVRAQFELMCFKAVQYLSRDNDLRRLLIHDPDIFPVFADKDPYQEINDNSVAMIKAILTQGIREKQFRPVDVAQVADIIFMIYKTVIVRTYIRAEEAFMQQRFTEAVNLFTRGLFLDEGD